MLLVALGLVAGLASPARAERGFEAGAFAPAPNLGRSLVGVESADLGPRHEVSASLWVSHAAEPLRLETLEDLDLRYVPLSRRLVGSQTRLHLVAAYSVSRWLELGLDLPVVVHQQGDALAGLDSPAAVSTAAGVGDLRLVPRLLLYRSPTSPRLGRLGLAVSTALALPTGSRERFQGSGGAIAPRAIVEWATPVGPRLVANLGYSFRPESEAAGLRAAGSFAWAVGLEVPATRFLRVLATVQSDLASEASLAVAASFFGVDLLAGAAAGLPGDPLSPSFRLFFAAGYSWRPAATPEPDPGPEAAAPGLAAPCPEPALAAAAPACAVDDRDGDGLVDSADLCPDEAEDRDGFEDSDGCPDPDNDGDGIPDGSDRCPDDPEDFDGDRDEDGCPDLSEAVAVDLVVYFATGSAELRPEDRYPLGRLARTLAALPEGAHVFVEGYADDTGGREANEALSLRRARAVADHLVARGAPRERLSPIGYGQRAPAVVGEGELDRQVNRRVEFRLAPRVRVEAGSGEGGER